MMPETLHTYHATKDESRGLHLITTSDHSEAMTMLRAAELRDALEAIVAWEGVILDAAEAHHGHNAIYQGLLEICEQAGDALAGKSQPKGNG
jgi:hypothetical protein